MPVGTTAAIMLGLGGIGAGIGASKLMSGGQKQAAFSPIALPQAPNPAASADKASEIVKKKKSMATQSIYTSPLGVAGEAQVARKTLTGQ